MFCFEKCVDWLEAMCSRSLHRTYHKDMAYDVNILINLFWSIKISNDVLKKLKSNNFQAFCLSTYDFSTLYTSIPHNLIRNNLTSLIEKKRLFEKIKPLSLVMNIGHFYRWFI